MVSFFDQGKHLSCVRSAQIDKIVAVVLRDLSFPTGSATQTSLFDQLAGRGRSRIFENGAPVLGSRIGLLSIQYAST
jgi:hypothetical protein